MDSNTLNPIEYFRFKASESQSSASISNMMRAINSLARFGTGVDMTFDCFNLQFLSEWVARQFFDGYYCRTVAYNISKIAALYNKAVSDGAALPSTAFSEMLAKVKRCGTRFDGADRSETFHKLRRIVCSDLSSHFGHQLAKDIIVFGLVGGGMTLSKIATLKKDDYTSDNEHIREIIARYSKPKSKYLFPLNQTQLTPKQVLQKMEVLVADLLKSVDVKSAVEADLVLVDLWCDVAMSCGLSSADIASCLSEYRSLSPLIYFATSANVSQRKKTELRECVASVLTDNPTRWFAMHLRQHVSFSDLTDRLKEQNIRLDEIYYPMGEILRKVGKKKIYESQPVISWLVFFRSRVTQLNNLYDRIDDLAWGYRYVHDVKSPYAVISDDEIKDYQRAIGTLSPYTEMLDDNAVELREGDYVMVLGGLLDGRHAVFESERRLPASGYQSGRVICRVRLVGGKSANWIVDCDPRLVKKITREQYKQIESRQNEMTD